MPRRNSLFPRPIAPELIMEGDTIECEYPSDGGITITKRGTVGKIDAWGGLRYFSTDEGGTLAVYQPGRATNVKFTILLRNYQHETLSLFDDPDRIGA